MTGGRGGTWSANGVILFNGYNDGQSAIGIRRRAGRGDEYRPVAQRELTPLAAVPSRRPTLSVLRSSRQSAGAWRLRQRLDRPTEKTRLLGSTAAWYAPGRDAGAGYLLWVRDDHLVAQPLTLQPHSWSAMPFRSPSDRLPRARS